MNILYIYSSPIDPMKGGIQKVTFNLSRYFASLGHNIKFLSFFRSDVNQKDFVQLFCPNCNQIKNKENEDYLYKVIRDNNISVVINQSGMSPEVCDVISVVKKEINFLLLSCIHNSIYGGVENYDRSHIHILEKYGISRIAKIFDLTFIKKLLCSLYTLKNRRHYCKLLENSDRVVTLTNAMRDELKKMTGIQYDKKIAVIPNGTEISKQKISEFKKDNIFLFVGKINYGYKRADLLLPIWKDFSERNNKYKLYVLGDGEKRRELEDLCIKNGIKNIEFKGWCNPIEYYKQAKGLIMTSCSEGLPMVLIEAMSYGVIPFAYDAYRQIHEVVENGKNGFLVKDCDYKALSAKMDYIMNLDEETLNRISMDVYNKSLQFDVSSVINKWIELITLNSDSNEE